MHICMYNTHGDTQIHTSMHQHTWWTVSTQGLGSAVREDHDVTRGGQCIQSMRDLGMEHRHQLPAVVCKQVHDGADREGAVVITGCRGGKRIKRWYTYVVARACTGFHIILQYIQKKWWRNYLITWQPHHPFSSSTLCVALMVSWPFRMDPTSPASRTPRSRKHSTVAYFISADWLSARKEGRIRVRLRWRGGKERLKNVWSHWPTHVQLQYS